MKKSTKKQTTKVEKLSPRMMALLFLPWREKHHNHHTEIEAYLPGGDWQTIIEINDTPGIDAEMLANFVLLAANNFEKSQQIISEMANSLENCLSCDRNLTVKAEQEAMYVLRKAKEMGLLDLT